MRGAILIALAMLGYLLATTAASAETLYASCWAFPNKVAGPFEVDSSEVEKIESNLGDYLGIRKLEEGFAQYVHTQLGNVRCTASKNRAEAQSLMSRVRFGENPSVTDFHFGEPAKIADSAPNAQPKANPAIGVQSRAAANTPPSTQSRAKDNPALHAQGCVPHPDSSGIFVNACSFPVMVTYCVFSPANHPWACSKDRAGSDSIAAHGKMDSAAKLAGNYSGKILFHYVVCRGGLGTLAVLHNGGLHGTCS